MAPTTQQNRYRGSLAAVLAFAWDTVAFRADDVIASLQLTRSTTLSALDELISIGLIREVSASGDSAARMGRPARRFELHGEAGILVGLDAGGRHFSAVAADLTGRVLASEHAVLPATKFGENLDPERRRATALRLIDDALSSIGRARSDVVAVGIGLPAPVDRDGLSPETTKGFWQGMNADLQASLEEHFPVVRTENDASLAAVAEGTFGAARGCEHYVAMLSGRRLGSGVVVEGSLLRGAHGAVGELEALTQVIGVGGTRGLGMLAEDWVRDHKASLPKGHPWAALSADRLTAEEILATTTPGDPSSEALLTELGHRLGRICNMLARFYDPKIIVVCGAVAGALDAVIERAQRDLASDLDLPAPTIVASELGGDAVSIGAVAAAREAVRDLVIPLFDHRRQSAADA